MKESFLKKCGRATALFVAVTMMTGISAAAFAAPGQPPREPGPGPQQPGPQKPGQPGQPGKPGPQKPGPAPQPAPAPKPAPQPAPPQPAPPAPRYYDKDDNDDFVKGALTGAVLGVVIDRVIK